MRRSCRRRRRRGPCDYRPRLGDGPVPRSLVALLLALAQAEIPMIADDLALRGPAPNIRDPRLPVMASFTVTAYRPATPEQGRGP